MAMVKAEMQAHRASYYELLGKAQDTLLEGLVPEAVAYAVRSLVYVDGMMQFERKYEERQFASIDAIDLILSHAPFIFDLPSINQVAALLKSQRRIEKNTSVDFKAALAESLGFMWCAYHLWNYLERNGACDDENLSRVLGGTDEQRRAVVEACIAIGTISRSGDSPHRLRLTTRIDDKVHGKCPNCGASGKSAKSNFLEEHHCPRCKSLVSFVTVEGSA